MSGLAFVDLTGMIDPARAEVPEAIKVTQHTGRKTVMVTGDHRLTAVAIAIEIWVLKEKVPGSVMSEEKVEEIDDVRVFVRISSEHKMRIALSLKRNGHIGAMTRDGVNDAPALKAVDIEIAMGIKGTEITREAFDMILEDDNFATIVRAIQGGCHIYDNVNKYLRLMLATSFDEFIEITIVTLLGLPRQFLPIHILWVNLVTDGLPAVALSIDSQDPPDEVSARGPKEGLLTRFW
ncbi:MAG: HAD-IC family P-type ATPase [Candidatus Bathyarchaeota archaeon]|nr:HAD-IC family P-type ATPase [Candidatus Bathyarchaeota archaeon]